MGNSRVIFVLAFSLVLALTIITTQIPLADALKSSGNSLSETNSKRVCGVSLCDNPMTMEEKIKQYLLEQELPDGSDQQISKYSDDGIANQGYVMPGSPAQQALVGQGITSQGIKNLIKPTNDWREDKKITKNYDDTVLFTWTKDFTNIKPYFTIQKIQGSSIGVDFYSNTQINLDKMLAAYVSGLEGFDYVDSVVNTDISEISYGKGPVYYISGTILVKDNGGTNDIRFTTLVSPTESGDVYSITLNAGNDDFNAAYSDLQELMLPFYGYVEDVTVVGHLVKYFKADLQNLIDSGDIDKKDGEKIKKDLDKIIKNIEENKTDKNEISKACKDLDKLFQNIEKLEKKDKISQATLNLLIQESIDVLVAVGCP